MRKGAWFVGLVLVVSACGSGAETEPGEGDRGTGDVVTTASSATPTTMANPTTTMATTTTTIATTTTTEADPSQTIADELAARGIAPDLSLEDVVGLEDAVCVFGIDGYESTPSPIDLETSVRFFLMPPGLGSPDQGELIALIVETYCPDHADKLGFTSDQYAAARTEDLQPGDCFLTNQFALVPVECAERHDGEVVSFIDASEKGFPADQEAGFGWFEGLDCLTPQVEYLGEAAPLGSQTRRMARTQEEWDNGETRVMCAIAATGRILQGSVAGQGAAINEVAELVTFTASVCTLESLEATLTSDAPVDVAVSLDVRDYYPEGMRFEEVYPQLAAGETLTISNTYEVVRDDLPADCSDPFLTVVPVPLG